MPPNRKITFVEVDQKKFFKFQDILDSGILGPIAVAGGAGTVAYILTNSGEIALRVIGGVYFVAVWLNQRIRIAKKKNKGD